jgi:hypothetical protein
MRITFMQSGGFVGTIKGCVLTAAELTSDERQELESLVVAGGLTGSSERFSEAGRDLRHYDIMIEQDTAVHRLSCDDRSVPEAVRPLVAFLQTRARPQPPDFAARLGRSGTDRT